MDKEQLAIARLQDAARLSEHRYKKPLMVTYSGGNGQRTLLPDEDDQQSAWSVRMRERKVRLVATVGQLLFRLADCMEAGQHRNKDEEVRV